MEPIDPARHGDALFAAFSEDRERRLWTYLNIGPFPTRDAFDAWMQAKCLRDDPLYHAIIDRSTGEAGGFASLMRIDRGSGVIEIGNVVFAPRLQRSTLATEAMYLMMRRVFEELGNRRYEWRCDSLNAASRRAAERLGFTFEGVFRQARVYKGRTRDTAWYAMLDQEWATLRPAYEAWLSDANFVTNRGRTPGYVPDFPTVPEARRVRSDAGARSSHGGAGRRGSAPRRSS